jgi:hypothetical protein
MTTGDGYYQRRAFCRASTSLGMAAYKPHTPGHWIYMAGALAPLAAGAVFKEPTERWRAIRAIAVLESVALLVAELWTHRGKQQGPRSHALNRTAEQGCSR